MVKDVTEYFLGIFFSVSFIYFVVMFLVLKDRKASLAETVYSTNPLGETTKVQGSKNNLIELN